jgi:pyrroloquinoline quinone biosynthesis protein D
MRWEAHTVRGRHKNRAPGTGVRLAPGIHLDGAQVQDAGSVLLCPDGKVQLNRTAAMILRLCDGSRNRQDVVKEVVRQSHQQTRAAEIIEFLDAARARGWIYEA